MCAQIRGAPMLRSKILVTTLHGLRRNFQFLLKGKSDRPHSTSNQKLLIASVSPSEVSGISHAAFSLITS